MSSRLCVAMAAIAQAAARCGATAKALFRLVPLMKELMSEPCEFPNDLLVKEV